MKGKSNFHFIRYHDGYVQSDGVLLPKFKTKKITKRHVRRYGNHAHLKARLDRCSNLLIEYLADNCGYLDNEVFNTKRTRLSFIKFCIKNCSVNFEDDTVKKAYRKLVEAGLLLQYDARGIYTVNPVHYYSGPEDSRRELIRQLINYCISSQGKTKRQLKKALGLI